MPKTTEEVFKQRRKKESINKVSPLAEVKGSLSQHGLERSRITRTQANGGTFPVKKT